MRNSMRFQRVIGSSAVIVIVASTVVLRQHVVQGQARVRTIAATSDDNVRVWDNTVNSMLRTEELRVRLQREDALLPGRTIEQLDQYYKGVRVWGGRLSRQLDGLLAVSVFGTLYVDVNIDTTPTLTSQEGKAAIERAGRALLGADRLPELVILSTDGGQFRLAWVGEVASLADSVRFFVDAKTGNIVRSYSIRQRQTPNAAVVNRTGFVGGLVP